MKNIEQLSQLKVKPSRSGRAHLPDEILQFALSLTWPCLLQGKDSIPLHRTQCQVLLAFSSAIGSPNNNTHALLLRSLEIGQSAH